MKIFPTTTARRVVAVAAAVVAGLAISTAAYARYLIAGRGGHGGSRHPQMYRQ